MSWKEEIIEDFKELVTFDSVSFQERKTADWITGRLKMLNFSVEEDEAGSYYGGNAGNIYASLEGTKTGEPVVFCAHMDVVEPGCGKRAVTEPDGNIHAAGDTVLGADDICGILEILYGVRLALESGKPYRKTELLFTIGEELYVKGSEVFDFSKIKSKEAYVLDLSGAVGKAAYRAPSIISIHVEIIGRAAHAGFEPERGVHAIAVAAKGISRLDLGHVDEETTFNIGTIEGGTATNIVPDRCVFAGEIRSYHHEKALEYVKKTEQIFKEEAKRAGALAKVTHQVHLTAYETSAESVTVKNFREACKRTGLLPELTETFGGSDNNSFAGHGIEGLVLSNGMYLAHSVKEYTRAEDLWKGARLVKNLILL